MTEAILWALNKTMGKKSVGKPSTPKETQNIMIARVNKRKARKNFDEACKNNKDKIKKLSIYKDAQTTLKQAIQEEEEKANQPSTKY